MILIKFWNIFVVWKLFIQDLMHGMTWAKMWWEAREEFSVKFGHIIRDSLTLSLGFSIQKILSWNYDFMECDSRTWMIFFLVKNVGRILTISQQFIRPGLLAHSNLIEMQNAKGFLDCNFLGNSSALRINSTQSLKRFEDR